MRFLEKYRLLAGGARLYQITSRGEIYTTGDGNIRRLDHNDPEISKKLLTFINEGNEAYYLVGEPDTGPDKVCNATFKFGITAPHHSFIPHVHGSQHFVKSEGYSGCILYDREKKEAFPIYLIPGTIIEIPEMVPHAFFNRADDPLVILVANTGLGIHHENYAITLEKARKRLERQNVDQEEFRKLIDELTQIEDFMKDNQPEHAMGMTQRAGRMFRQIADWLNSV